jgi:hypothetical protein
LELNCGSFRSAEIAFLFLNGMETVGGFRVSKVLGHSQRDRGIYAAGSFVLAVSEVVKIIFRGIGGRGGVVNAAIQNGGGFKMMAITEVGGRRGLTVQRFRYFGG